MQEFIRVRPTQERDRDAMVLALVTRSFTNRTLIFFRSKQHCHRMAIVFALCGIRAAELHGNLTQAQRLGESWCFVAALNCQAGM